MSTRNKNRNGHTHPVPGAVADHNGHDNDTDKKTPTPAVSPPREVTKECRITAPVRAVPAEAYLQRHVETGNLTHEQSTALSCLRHALSDDKRPRRLKPRDPSDPGKVVTSGSDAVRWLLEQIAEEMGLYETAVTTKTPRH